MRERQNIEQINSVNNMQAQQMLSMSQSKVSMQKLDSHIKSNLQYLQGKKDKKYVYVKVHNSFNDIKEQNCANLIAMLRQQFQDKLQLKFFKQTKQLLADNYDDNELHYIIVPQKHLSWAETFARQEREESDNKKKIFIYGILKKSVFQEKIKARSRKKIEKVSDYIDYFFFEDEDYPQRIAKTIEDHLDQRLRQQGNHVKTWALTNKFAGKQLKKRTLHFYYEQVMKEQLTGLYRTYKKKSKSSWIQIYEYKSFEDVLKRIREREVSLNKQIDVAKRVVTSKILKSQSQIDSPMSMKSVFLDNSNPQLNSSILSSSIRAINKLDQNDVNIIICHGHHSQLEKFRALVRAQKYGNWFLWEIQEGSSDFLTQLKDFLNEEVSNNQLLEAEQYQRIIHAKNLYILALNSDGNTIDMFNSQRNVLHNMELLLYADAEQFSLLLREGAKSNEDFVIAVVPGGFRSYATEYNKVVTQFEARYKQGEWAWNYKFIINANGRHVSNIGNSNLLGTQSNLTYYDDNSYLQNIMKQRDRHFHPFQGLKGHNVYLLIKQTIHDLLDGIREYVSNSPRLHISTYIDKQFLKRQIETITLKDSVVVITNDSTLREAQAVTRQFDQVCILNITDRQKVKQEVKVISSGNKEMIYDLIKEIPQIHDELEKETYDEVTPDESYVRQNRVLPKKLNFRPGDTIAIRLPAKLQDEQSRKMQVRLQSYFNKQIKIQYYKQPRDIRLVNKLQEPLSFIVWADSKGEKDKRTAELQFFKELALNQIEELRQEFIVYSEQPKQYQYLTVQPNFQRFKFVSSRWQRIQQYIIGTYKRFRHDEQEGQSIYSDEMIRVFFDNNDKNSRELIAAVTKRRDKNQLNAANHVQFHIMEDMQTVLSEQSPFHKYFVIFNEETSKITKAELLRIINNNQNKHIYFRIIVIQQEKAKKIQAVQEKVRKVVGSEGAAGEWLCAIKVLPANCEYCFPHVLIDKSTLDYYYFLDKYSQLTRKFTFNYFQNKEDLKKQVLGRKTMTMDQIWVVVRDIKTLNQYSKWLQKAQNFKNVRFLLQSGDQLPSTLRTKVVFRSDDKREIHKFLLNFYRRDNHIFFPSSIGKSGSIALIIMNGMDGKPIPINRLQISSWQDIIKAKVFLAKDISKLIQIIRSLSQYLVYVVYPFVYEKELTDICGNYSNVRRISLQPFPQYDPRKLRLNFVQNSNKIYIGTYPTQITDQLRYLRYNIRRSELFLQKGIKNQLIEINIQKQYKMSQSDLTDLTAKNDSVIVYRNGYELDELPSLLARSTRYNYLQIYIGDQLTGKSIGEFNDKKGKDVKFIDAKASPLAYMKGESKLKHCLLQTNQQDQLFTYLLNLPENRYEKALTNRGKFVIYYNPGDETLKKYIVELKKIQQRNSKLICYQFSDTSKLAAVVKDPGVVLIHSLNEKEYLDKVKPVNGLNYMILSQQCSNDKNYASYGNKYFIARRAKQFQHFVNQLNLNFQPNLEPITLAIDEPAGVRNSIRKYNSKPVNSGFFDLKILPPFIAKPNEQTQDLTPVQLKATTLDNNPPSLMKINFPKADLPSLPLGVDVLKRIINHIAISDNPALKPGLDNPPSKGWFNIKSDPDTFLNLPKSIPIPRPAPIYKSKLAILHPSTPQFSLIGDMLKRNLQPQQFLVDVIAFKSEHELQEYSKNNGQRLNGYDKIVVFLSYLYRKYDSNLRQMKSKLNNRMEYFIFDDEFHRTNHNTLKVHLRPYKIKKYKLPYTASVLPKHLTSSPKILILVPLALSKRYQQLKSSNVNVVTYLTDAQIHPHLHKEGMFVILVSSRQNYHDLKIHAKVSPRCKLVIDTPKDLPDDQLYLFRINTYSIYYGPDPVEYLRNVIPAKPIPPFYDQLKFLFFGTAEEDLVFQYDYEDYEKVNFRQWRDLYNLILFNFRNKSNWLIKNSPGRPELIPLHPKVYLQNNEYMKDFKNNFQQVGYLNEETVARKSTLVLHEFADLPQIYYLDDKQLSRHLQKQQAPSVVLFNSSNNKIKAMIMKYGRHKWVGITDHSQRWIDAEGILPEVKDERLKRKQDMFTSMFNSRVFDQFNDMQYYYLSNKAHVDHNRNIFFRTKEQLLQIYQKEQQMLMVVFVEAKDISHIPQAVLAEGSQENGRVKMILLKTQFVDDFDTLYIKFNQIDPVIKHINAVEAAGRIDFIVYNQGDGERSRQTLILKRKLNNFENQPYNNFIDIQEIARNIKGRYKKVYVICFPDEKNEITNIFNTYSIANKGLINEGVQFILIDRLSTIKPNPSHISNIRANNPSPNSTSRIQTPPKERSNSKTQTKHQKQDSRDNAANIRGRGNGSNGSSNGLGSNSNTINSGSNGIGSNGGTGSNGVSGSNGSNGVSGSNGVGSNGVSGSNSGSNPIYIAPYAQPQPFNQYGINVHGSRQNNRNLFDGDIEIPSPQSVIKPAAKMDSILANKNFVLNIDQKLKGLFPVGKFFANKVNYFSGANGIPTAERGVAQLVISTQVNPEIVSLSDEPQTLVVVVGKNGLGLREDSGALVIAEDEIPGLIKRLQGSNVQDQLNNIRNIDDYSKVRVVYDKDMDSDSKRRLLAASQRNKKILPTMYKSVGKLRQYMQQPDSLLLLMMSYDPENLEAAVAQQNRMIVKKKKVKMIVPRKSQSDVDGLETILEEEEVDQEEAVRHLTDEQVDIYLKIYENTEGQRPPLARPDDWQGEREQQPADLDNITKLNVHSNIRPQNFFREQQIQKIKQRLTGDLIVLVIDSGKRGQVDEAVSKYNVLVQAYTNSMNLQNDIRDRKDNVTLAVIDRNMLDKIGPIKKKYPHAAFILESDSPHDEGIEQYRPYLAGQIKKMSDLQKIIAELYQENQRIRYNAESIRAASRFDMKKTSIVDVSNNERFTVGLSNQKSKKAFLFYKQPDNNHVKARLSDTFNNISYIPYKSVADFKRLIGTYNTYSSILIANGGDIPELQDFVSKKKQMIYVIRFNPPADLRDNPKVKKLFSTYKRDDLQKFIFDQFQKNSLALAYDNSLDSKYRSNNKNVEGKRYIQKYEPNTFGTTPRFPGDFVPPKSKQSTYSRKYMKSMMSRSKLSSRLQTLSPKNPRIGNMDYFPT